MRRWRIILCIWTGLLTMAMADSTINTTNKWAWGAGTGWVNCRPDSTNGAVIGEFVCSHYLYSLTYGWIHLGSGQPTNGFHYCNTATNDYGVNHDGKGNLRGYAWAPNIGWINFEDTGAPHVDLLTGCVTGYAWSPTSGWIGFTNFGYYTQSDRIDAGPDGDGDTIPDMWEISKTGSTTNLNQTGDYDHDGFLDVQEYRAGTDPMDSNSLLQVVGFITTNGTNMCVTWDSNPTRLYRIETCDTLVPSAAWTNAGLGTIFSDSASNTTRVLLMDTSTQRYYRITAVLPMSH